MVEKKQVRISIIVRTSFVGIHSWPDAPEYLPEAYLRYPHRHVFYVEATKLVSHTERDVEFIGLKRQIDAFCGAWSRGPHEMSCERMAELLCDTFSLSSCRVLEDNENGAEVIVDISAGE